MQRLSPVGGYRLELEHVGCPVCGRTDSDPIGVGEDFEYRTAPDTFVAMRCPDCTVVYLDPRPTATESHRIYPDQYHAFQFTEQGYGLVYRVRARLEARRLLRSTRGVPVTAHIVDIGCGDGFHLDLLRRHGPPGWSLEGVDVDPRAVVAARRRDLVVHEGAVELLDLPEATYDVALMIQTIEHVADPRGAVASVRRLLKPGGRLVIVTDNTGTLDFRLFRRRHWGGYHFPRHFSLFDPESIARLGEAAGMEVIDVETIVSPVNWVFSIRNILVDHGAPSWLVRQFGLTTPVSLGVFTAIDVLARLAGRGALLRVELRRPL